MKKTVISFLMAGLLLIGMPALAQEGDCLIRVAGCCHGTGRHPLGS